MKMPAILAMLSALLLLAAPTVQATDAPDPAAVQGFEASYQAIYGRIRGAQTHFQLERDGETWVWRSKSEPAGMLSLVRSDVITEESRFILGPHGLQPTGYHYVHRRGDDIRRERRLDFDWQELSLISVSNGNEERFELPAGSLDRFLAQYAVMRDLAADKRRRSYQLVDRAGPFRQAMEYGGKERIRTPAGRFDTQQVIARDEDSDRKLVLWMAPELGYLPVRMERREPGETTVRLELTEWKGLINP
jgi:hypothetical protein